MGVGVSGVGCRVWWLGCVLGGSVFCGGMLGLAVGWLGAIGDLVKKKINTHKNRKNEKIRT